MPVVVALNLGDVTVTKPSGFCMYMFMANILDLTINSYESLISRGQPFSGREVGCGRVSSL